MGVLNDLRLRMSKEVESRNLSDGTHLCKQTLRAEYLAFTPEQQRILARFQDGQVVQEVLHAMLKDGAVTQIRGFYDLVAHALEKGFLEKDGATPHPRLVGKRWRLGLDPWPALIFSGLTVTLGLLSFQDAPLAIPGRPVEWLWALGLFVLGLSFSNLMAGVALSGAGRMVYGAGIQRVQGIPCFSLDVRDAFMGGRSCEVVVALMRLSTPFLMLLASWSLSYPPLMLAAQVLALVLTSPFGASPMHDLLYALLRREHQLPRFADRFFRTRLVSQVLQWKSSLAEDRYLLLHSTYAILWLGLLVHMAADLFDRYGSVLIWNLRRASVVGGWLESLVGFSVLVLALAVPLGLILWVLLKSAWRMTAARFFPAEACVVRDGGGRPSDENLLGFLKKTILFSQMPEAELPGVLKAMRWGTASEGDMLIREGDEGDQLFVLHRGKVEVLKDDESGTPQRVATLGPGDVFGEIALLDRMRRTSSIRCLEGVELLALSREEFHRLLTSSLGAEQIRMLVQVCAFLRKNALFADWHPQALAGFSREFAQREVAAGELILQEGRPNEFFYLIHEGSFEVRRGGKAFATLGSGEFCGEISLLRNIPATADVVAIGKGRCFQLGREIFLKFVSRDFSTGFAIESALESRMKGRSS